MSDAIAMLVSTALGTLNGWERQMGHKPAGLRTHVLVCMGSTLFVLVTKHAMIDISADGARLGTDPTRIIHGVITGVGFLGAGSIIRQEGYIHGLTTAASVWMVAAIGVTVGVHAYPLAVSATVMALLVLVGFRWAERHLARSADIGER